MADLKALAEQIVGLTLLEAGELKTILKDEYGIEPAAGGAVMMAGGGGDAGAGVLPSPPRLQSFLHLYHERPRAVWCNTQTAV